MVSFTLPVEAAGRPNNTAPPPVSCVAVIALALGAFGAGDGRIEARPPDSSDDVTVALYVCASGDFAFLYNEDALDRLAECSEGIPGAEVSIRNADGESIGDETGPDGTAVLGPIAMSRIYTGYVGVVAEGYSCMTLETRIGAAALRAGDNILAIRLHKRDIDVGECKADEPE